MICCYGVVLEPLEFHRIWGLINGTIASTDFGIEDQATVHHTLADRSQHSQPPKPGVGYNRFMSRKEKISSFLKG